MIRETIDMEQLFELISTKDSFCIEHSIGLGRVLHKDKESPIILSPSGFLDSGDFTPNSFAYPGVRSTYHGHAHLDLDKKLLRIFPNSLEFEPSTIYSSSGELSASFGELMIYLDSNDFTFVQATAIGDSYHDSTGLARNGKDIARLIQNLNYLRDEFKETTGLSSRYGFLPGKTLTLNDVVTKSYGPAHEFPFEEVDEETIELLKEYWV